MTVVFARRLRAAFCAFTAFTAMAASAASFTPGNVVVYRIGSGTGALSANGNPVFLDEYTPTGTLKQSVPMPTAGSGAQRPLIASGTATTDGLLTRSGDGACLAVPGYGRNLVIGTGSGNLNSGTISPGVPVPRVVARVTAQGLIDTTTAVTDAYLSDNFRGAASADCTDGFHVSGGTGGVRFVPLGDTTSIDLSGSGFADTRAVAVQSGQLYASAAVGFRGVATIGTGTPTLGPVTVTKLPGLTDANHPSNFAFFLADLTAGVAGFDTLYIADQAAGALSKFSLVGGAWVFNGKIGVATDVYRGITGVANGSVVTLYATRRTGPASAPAGGELVSLTDASGYNGAFAGTPAIIATAGPNTVFRGVALAPGFTVTPSAGPHGSIDITSPQMIAAGASAKFIITPEPGYQTLVGGSCHGNLVGTTYTTDPVTASCTVEATFTLVPTFTIAPSVGLHGTLSPSTPFSVLPGTAATFTVVPDPGYSASVGGTCHGNLVGTVYTTDPVNADCTVVATFTLITFNVTPTAGLNGSISPDTTQTVPLGASAVFTLTPDFGFDAIVGGSCGGVRSGNRYTTLAVTGDCTVSVTFPPLPRHAVTASAGAHGSVSPTSPGPVISGQSATFTVAPDAGYHAAVRGTCGGVLSGNTFTTNAVIADCTVVVVFAKRLVLFVGNSYTFGRVDPVMRYNAANVTDLTYEMWRTNPTGSNDDEPHPWGGIPGVFKKLTDQAELEYDVSISARNAASLRGHYLNSNPAGWDLRGNIASQRWDAVVLQDLSDEPLPANRGANANLPYFNAYVDKGEAWIHQGAAETYTETQLFGGTTAACRALTGASTSACDDERTIPANPHARAATEVYLYQTWARPDMIAPNGTNANGTFYSAAEGLETMTADFHAAYFGRAAANPRIEDVSPVGDAFLRAVLEDVAMRDPYAPTAGKINLWHTDYFHPSKYGSYLSAAVHFATLTGLNPLMLGRDEMAAKDLGIDADIAVQLQRVAQATVAPDTTAPVSSAAVSTPANANGWNNADVTVTFSAADEARGSGVDSIAYALSGAQSASGTVASGGSVAITAEGVTTITWHATDRAGNAGMAHTLRISIDKSPPLIAGMPGAGCNLWPPNHKMVEVATVSATERFSRLSAFSVTATSSEAASPGESDIAIAGSGVDPRRISLRAERLGSGSGRVYTVTASATDEAGNSATAASTCVVPHDRGK